MNEQECPRIEQTQVYVKDVSRGNCFSAMIAGILKIPIERVPLFGSENGKPWQHNANEFLRPYGLAWLPLDGNDFPAECVQYGIKDVWHEIAGESARGVGHSCAAKDGALAWDPHPSQSGLEKVWWHGVFIALRPWEAAARIEAAKKPEEKKTWAWSETATERLERIEAIELEHE